MNYYSIFSSIGITYMRANSMRDALKKFINEYRFQPDSIIPGYFKY